VRTASPENSKGAGFPQRPCRLNCKLWIQTKERVTNAGKTPLLRPVFKIPRGKNCVDTDADEFTFGAHVHARVAELADAVDSKSTDASLVGSTPTPGTLLCPPRTRACVLPPMFFAVGRRDFLLSSSRKHLSASTAPTIRGMTITWEAARQLSTAGGFG
jgi:hypothetical protein